MNRVYVFHARLSPEAERVANAEINRGRHLYNEMIAQYNPHPRQTALSVQARHKLAGGDCYSGTFFATMKAFQAATSAKREGVWPGDPYDFRRLFSNIGTSVGAVWMLSSGMTWGKVVAGRTSLFSVENRGKYSAVRLKVSRNDDPIEFSAHVRREIPSDASVTSAYLVRTGNYARRHKWELHVSWSLDVPQTEPAPAESRVGVDVGWKQNFSTGRVYGPMTVAVTSSGVELTIPAYAVRMARKADRIAQWRRNWANAVKARHPECQAKSANGIAGWCRQHCDVSEAAYLQGDHALRCREDHVRERSRAIREDLYRKFAVKVGSVSFITKPDLKGFAVQKKRKKKGEPADITAPVRREHNFHRALANNHELLLLLRQKGAIEVVCERLGEPKFNEPNVGKARKILASGVAGHRVQRAARKPTRKFRKRLETA